MKLKPLEWQETITGLHVVSDTPFGLLSVTQHIGDRFFITFGNTSTGWVQGSLEEAQEIAEEIYREKVYSLFDIETENNYNFDSNQYQEETCKTLT
jgi:hypothetical protein